MLTFAPFSVLAQEGAAAALLLAGGCILMLVYLALIALMIVSQWFIYAKAHKPGWASIVPIYNLIVLLEICGKPIWWIILFFIPIVGIVPAIILIFSLARVFGKGVGFGFGLLFLGPIFFPVLAFGSAQYQGPDAR